MNLPILKTTIILLVFFSFSFPSFAQVEEIMEMEDIEIDMEEAPIWSDSKPKRDIRRIGEKFALEINGKLISEAIYDRVPYILMNGFIVQKGEHFGLVNLEGKEVIAIAYDSIGVKHFFGSGEKYIVKKEGLYGWMDSNGEVVLPAKFKKIYGINGMCQTIVKNDEGKMSLLNPKGELVANQLDYVFLFNNLVFAYKNQKAAIFTATQHTEFIYDSLSFDQAYAVNNYQRNRTNRPTFRPYLQSSKEIRYIIVRKDKKLGMVDTSFQMMVPIEQSNISYYKAQKYYSILQNGDSGRKHGIFFPQTQKYIKPQYDYIKSYDLNLGIFVNKDKMWGVINKQGEIQIPLVYSRIDKANKSYIYLYKNRKKGLAEYTGKILIPTIYDDIEELSGSYGRGSLYEVKSDTLSGLVDEQHNKILPVAYTRIFKFEEYYLIAEKQNLVGLYSLQGKEIAPPVYDWIYSKKARNASIVITRKEGKYGAINLAGQTVLENIYEPFVPIFDEDLNRSRPMGSNDRMYRRLKNTKGEYGLMDYHTGEITVPVMYNDLSQTLNLTPTKRIYVAKLKKKSGIIDQKNNTVLGFNYDSLSLYLCADVLEENISLVAKKKGNWGLVSLKNKVLIPIEYKALERISISGLFKASKGKGFMLINEKNEVLHPGPFDDISEYYEGVALAFKDGKACELSLTGEVLKENLKIQMHQGFKTMYGVKMALIKAMDSKEDSALYYFAQKIAPSPHVFYFLSMHEKVNRKVNNVSYDNIVSNYYQKLRTFKYNMWNSSYFDKNNLYTIDYTRTRNGMITNTRFTDWAYDDTRTLEKFLRNSLRIDGFWISSYFLRSYR